MTRAKLTPKPDAMAARYAHFVDAYIANGGNGADAAIQAGYSPRSAARLAFKILERADVQETLAKRRSALAVKHDLTTDAVIAELSMIVHSDPADLFDDDGKMLPIKRMSAKMRRAISSIEVDELFDGAGQDRICVGLTKKVKLWDKNSAIEKAMKHLGLFAEDNKQRASALDELSRDVLKEIEARLNEMAAQDGR